MLLGTTWNPLFLHSTASDRNLPGAKGAPTRSGIAKARRACCEKSALLDPRSCDLMISWILMDSRGFSWVLGSLSSVFRCFRIIHFSPVHTTVKSDAWVWVALGKQIDICLWNQVRNVCIISAHTHKKKCNFNFNIYIESPRIDSGWKWPEWCLTSVLIYSYLQHFMYLSLALAAQPRRLLRRKQGVPDPAPPS